MLKRYDKDELKDLCIGIFYDYLISGKDFCLGKSVRKLPNGYTPVDCLHRMNLDKVNEIDFRIEFLKDAIKDSLKYKQPTMVQREMVDMLKEERSLIVNTSMKVQKARYAQYKVMDYARTGIRVPLNKKINSLYDDFIMEVLFYDDVTTLAGRYEEYKKLDNYKDRLEFLKKYTEVTHISFLFDKPGAGGLEYVFLLKGRPAHCYHKKTSGSSSEDYTLYCIQRGFAENEYLLGNGMEQAECMLDFKNLTLEDTMKICNNDVRQIIQSKLDIDKMDLELKADKDVRGSNYKILYDKNFKNSEEYERLHKVFSGYFIRYVCPSTGRVYFNELDFNILKLSEYYRENDYDSYVDSWWSIAHAGANPNSQAMIRC